MDKDIEILFDDFGKSTKLAQQYIIDGKDYWIPKSQIRHVDLIDQVVTLPEWLAHKKGLEQYA